MKFHTCSVRNLFFVIGCALLSLLAAMPLAAQTRRSLRGHVPAVLSGLQPAGTLEVSTNLYLAIALPLRNQDTLTDLITHLYDPGHPKFRQWLTSAEFTEQFCPSQADYLKVIRFAHRHGLEILTEHPNRMLVEVAGSARDVENAFQVHLKLYQHPKENRTFYAPDAEPTVEPDVPILHVAGLDNYIVPHPLDLKRLDKTPAASQQGVTPYATGSGPGGDFTGKDFRAAYAPGVTNTGAGQYIAIVDVGGPYYPSDIYKYEVNAGFSTNIVVTNILLSGWTGIPVGNNADDGEETLDIDMALSMAPEATILNYEGEAHAVFNRIATDNLAKQMTLSYGFGIDESIQQTFLEFAAQGQSLFQASGDGGADLPGGTGLTGEPYATIVGGTSLTTVGGGGAWSSETTWIGSGGGSSGYGIPPWQQGINMSPIQGSVTNRNYPDVSMLADTVIWWYFKNGVGGTVGGTSASSPQWAGFMALVNQAAAAQGLPPVGYLNPVVYAIGKGSYTSYTTAFHDISTGNNFNSQNPTRYAAAKGYDLCTGWGSPRGNATIAALIHFGTNDFTLNASQGGLNIVAGGVATVVVRSVPMNGFSGVVSLSLSNLPPGVTASFSPTAISTNTSILTVTTSSSAQVGSSNLIITATSGPMTHTMIINLNVVAPIPDSTPTSLAGYYNRPAIYTDGRAFGAGLDGSGFAYSANLLGPRPGLGNILFTLGPINQNDSVSCASQTIPLPAGQFTTLHLLATGINGNQNAQTFAVTYSDNSTANFSQSLSDWFTPQNYAGESIVSAMPYRDASNGIKDIRTFCVYDYAFTLDQTKTPKSIKFPNNGNIVILAMTLVNGPAAATLAGFYNRAGLYTDGTTFTNPPTGGIDGGGFAYSASLLGGAQNWNGVQFDFGPANGTDVVSCAGQIVPLPPGKYSSLRLLGTGLHGNQASQTVTVNYADGTNAAFVQGFSDWGAPQSNPGESKAVILGHRNVSNGTKDNRTFYLYGYSFNLDSSRTVQSVQLPNNANVIVTSISLVPNWPPTFAANPLSEPDGTAGQPYIGTIAANASDLNHDVLTFAKISGPAWLAVASNGLLSGTPLLADLGTNSFVVSVTDPGNLSSTASMNILVSGAAPIVVSISSQQTSVLLSWSGGTGPYEVQMSSDPSSSNWVGVTGPINSNSLTLTPTNTTPSFYRVLGH